MRHPIAFLMLLMLAAVCGKGGNDTVVPAKPAEFDAATVANNILSTLDKNGDGVIDVREAAASPGLSAAFAAIDADHSKTLSAAELTGRFELYKAPVSCSMPVAVYVLQNERPVVGAKVTLVPEPFFADVLKSATGTTDADGRCFLWEVDGQKAVGVSAGLYRIQVEKEGLPAIYNSATVLGCEILGGGRGQSEVSIRLNLQP